MGWKRAIGRSTGGDYFPTLTSPSTTCFKCKAPIGRGSPRFCPSCGADQVLKDYYQALEARPALPALPERHITHLTVVGGFGWELQPGATISLGMKDDVLMLQGHSSTTVPYSDLLDIEIAGGATTRGTRIIGGGFGLSGALEGMLIAGLINSLTRRTTINSFVRISSTTGEIALHHGSLLPAQLREQLAPAVHAVTLKRSQANNPAPQPEASPDPVAQLERLAALKAQGMLSEEEFAAAKNRLLGSL